MPLPTPALRLGLVLSFALGAAPASSAQRVDAPQEEPDAALYASPARRPISFSLGSYATRLDLDEGRSISEVVVPIGVSLPIGDRFGIAAQARYITAGGDGLTKLAGLSDLGLSATAAVAMGTGSLVLSLAGSAPLGSRQLEPGAFATAVLLSRDDLAFDVPSLGQGSRFAPGVSLSLPAGPRLAVGLGASILVSGSYQPFVGQDLSYAPAREILLTAGLTAETTPGSGVALDVTYVTYGDDEFGGQTYRPGDKLVGTFRWDQGRGFFALRGRYLRDGARQDAVEIAPARPLQASLSTGLRLGPEAFTVGLALGVRYYGDYRSTSGTSSTAELIDVLGQQQVLFEGGLSPSLLLAPGTRLTASAGYTLGVGALVEIGDIPPISGFRAGAGIAVEL